MTICLHRFEAGAEIFYIYPHIFFIYFYFERRVLILWFIFLSILLSILNMLFHVFSQIVCPQGGKVTLIAFVWLFSTVGFQMAPQSTWVRACIVTLVSILWFFLKCEYSDVFSNCKPERMQSHIGCIYFAFHHCGFSNVSSNILAVRMQSHIGCICLTFLHCVFSNVSSNRLLELMHNHTSCISLIFSQCTMRLSPCKGVN